MTRKALACTLLAVAGTVAITSYSAMKRQRHSSSLSARLEQILPVATHVEVSCAELAASRPLILLALGQSNAGNHGSPPALTEEAVTLIAEGKCIKAKSPLPGGTGTGGSIWQYLPALLSREKSDRPVVLSILAVDATSIGDWTNTHSPLRSRLALHVQSMRHLDLPPDFVLWQHGEADARTGTDSDDYVMGLHRVAATLNESGSNAPIILAYSTICQSAPSTAIRMAIESMVAKSGQFRRGPDSDVLSGTAYRLDGCHLTVSGMQSAARMWVSAILHEDAGRMLAPSRN